MATNDPNTYHGFPHELVQAVAHDAAGDADLVALFLMAFSKGGGWGNTNQTPRLPADFLLELAGTMRLLAWEQQGIRVHLEAGLPASGVALRGAFRLLRDRAGGHLPESPELLLPRILRLFTGRFAWRARAELGAEVLLGEADEDQLAEALADLLWENRHLTTEALTTRAHCP
jgi:hypothetical protein